MIELMTSKFTFKSFGLILSILPISLGLSFQINSLFDKTKALSPLKGISGILFFVFALSWLFFGELRTKMIKVKIENDFLIIKKFGGLSTGKKYYYSDIDGFKTSIVWSKAGDNEYLYLMQGDKKIGKLSDLYHRNYSEMKKVLETKLRDLGNDKYNFLEEGKEIFT